MKLLGEREIATYSSVSRSYGKGNISERTECLWYNPKAFQRSTLPLFSTIRIRLAMDTHEKLKILREDLRVLEATVALQEQEISRIRRHESDANEDRWLKLTERINANKSAITDKKSNIETLEKSLQTNLFLK